MEQGIGLGAVGPAVAAVGSSILGSRSLEAEYLRSGKPRRNHVDADRSGPDEPRPVSSSAYGKLPLGRKEDARATVGRLVPVPGGTNVIASRVDIWLDARHPDDAVTAALIEGIHRRAQRLAAEEGCTVTLTEESIAIRSTLTVN